MFDLVLTIQIKNWAKFNPRKDIKKPSWFALGHDLVTDPDFFSFNHGEFKAWIYILSQASKKQSETVFANIDHAEKVSGITKKDFLNAVRKLELLQVIHVHDTDTLRARDEDVTSPNPTQPDPTKPNQTEQRFFDFEFLYKKYPLKKGKATGLARLAKIITTQEDYDQFSKAIDRYKADCVASGTFFKHFSSFVGTEKVQPWRDWLDDDAGSTVAVVAPKVFNRANQRTDNNQAAAEEYKRRLRENAGAK